MKVSSQGTLALTLKKSSRFYAPQRSSLKAFKVCSRSTHSFPRFTADLSLAGQAKENYTGDLEMKYTWSYGGGGDPQATTIFFSKIRPSISFVLFKTEWFVTEQANNNKERENSRATQARVWLSVTPYKGKRTLWESKACVHPHRIARKMACPSTAAGTIRGKYKETCSEHWSNVTTG